MGHALACLTLLLLLAANQLPAAAADVASGTREVPLKEPSAAQKRLEAAITAYMAGNVDQAINGIGAALKAGLPASEAAKAHY